MATTPSYTAAAAATTNTFAAADTAEVPATAKLCIIQSDVQVLLSYCYYRYCCFQVHQ